MKQTDMNLSFGQTDNTWSVSQLNRYIDNLIRRSPCLQGIRVRGELSGVKLSSRGHLYFTVKDAESAVGCVMFSGRIDKLTFMPRDGMKIVATGSVSCYTPSGTYQLVVTDIEADGEGELAAAFERLKAKLDAEGLFAPERKKPLPTFPRRIGIITASTGAAVCDIIRICGRRCPCVELLVFPTPVQGTTAPAYLTKGIRYFNAMANDPRGEQNVDLIIIGRGGGSKEDLWCFNDEGLARAIAASEIPVISAVGHEIDVSISDFVADKSASTPSAAAELAVPDASVYLKRLAAFENRLTSEMRHVLDIRAQRLKRAESAPMLRSPGYFFESKREKLVADERFLKQSVTALTDAKKEALTSRAGKLEALSPLAVLTRGYAFVRDGRGPLTSVARIAAGDTVTVSMTDGDFDAKVLSVKPRADGQ